MDSDPPPGPRRPAPAGPSPEAVASSAPLPKAGPTVARLAVGQARPSGPQPGLRPLGGNPHGPGKRAAAPYGAPAYQGAQAYYGGPPAYAPPGYAPPGYAPAGYTPPGYTPPGYAPAGYAPAGYAPSPYYGAPVYYGGPGSYGYPAPPGGPPAAAYPYPVPYYVIAKPGEKTFGGLRLTKIGVFCAVTASVLSALGNFLLLGAVQSARDALANQGFAEALNSMGGIEALSLFLIFAALVGFIGVVTGIVGVVRLWRGAAEFGPDHQRAVRKGGLMIATTSVLYLIWGLVSAATNVSLSASMAGTPTMAVIETAIDSVVFDLIVTSLIALVAITVGALAMTTLLEKLVTREGRRRRGAFLGLSVGNAVLVLLMAFGIWAILKGPPANINSVQVALQWLGALLDAMYWLALVPAISSLLTIPRLRCTRECWTRQPRAPTR